MSPVAKMIEALLFLSPEPVNEDDLAEAICCDREEVDAALDQPREHSGE